MQKGFVFAEGDSILMHYDYPSRRLKFVHGRTGEERELTFVELKGGQEYAACINLCNNGDTVFLSKAGKDK